jgi:integrase
VKAKNPGTRPRQYVVPYLRGNVWWVRVPRIGHAPVPRSLGVTGDENKDKALAVCEFLRWCRSRPESWLLDQMASGKVAIQKPYRAWTENRLPSFLDELRAGVTDVDLEPYVAKWQAAMARQKRPNADTRAKYERQVRTLIQSGKPFLRSEFTKSRIIDWLDSLGVGQTNRYRAALSSFAKHLVLRDVLMTNPVVQIPMAKESEPRTLHLSQDEAKRLVDALPAPYKAFHALMLATGMEFGAASRVTTGDVGDRQVFARGTKRSHRARTVGVYDRWQWAWDVFWAFALDAPLVGPIFAGIDYDNNRWALDKALAAAKLPADYTTHDHRHTWAVQAIRDRIPRPMISSNLGHRDAAMLDRVYGRYIPTGADFAAIRSISHTAALPPGENPTHPEG